MGFSYLVLLEAFSNVSIEYTDIKLG
jgi:hypothetical protein